MRRKFALHPGYVTSKSDGETHYISGSRLARLYELTPDEYIIWDTDNPHTYMGYRSEDFFHLYPSYHGNYGRPRED